jgi:Cft2 family RNA processing exonuclease
VQGNAAAGKKLTETLEQYESKLAELQLESNKIMLPEQQSEQRPEKQLEEAQQEDEEKIQLRNKLEELTKQLAETTKALAKSKQFKQQNQQQQCHHQQQQYNTPNHCHQDYSLPQSRSDPDLKGIFYDKHSDPD